MPPCLVAEKGFLSHISNVSVLWRLCSKRFWDIVEALELVSVVESSEAQSCFLSLPLLEWSKMFQPNFLARLYDTYS